MKRDACRTIRQIFDEYQYDMTQVTLTLQDLRISEIASADVLMELLERAEKLEALIDLYAYLLACQDNNQPAR